jgi:tRNA/rRNA methyltransferase
MNKKSAFMFGPERSGLENDDIAIADAITIIPVSEIYKSLNLAQAVNVFCYEWFINLNSAKTDDLENINNNPADKQDIINMFEHLENELDKTGFFKVSHMKSRMINNIRNIFIRSNLSDQEVRTLRGIIKSLTNQ